MEMFQTQAQQTNEGSSSAGPSQTEITAMGILGPAIESNQQQQKSSGGGGGWNPFGGVTSDLSQAGSDVSSGLVQAGKDVVSGYKAAGNWLSNTSVSEQQVGESWMQSGNLGTESLGAFEEVSAGITGSASSALGFSPRGTFMGVKNPTQGGPSSLFYDIGAGAGYGAQLVAGGEVFEGISGATKGTMIADIGSKIPSYLRPGVIGASFSGTITALQGGSPAQIAENAGFGFGLGEGLGMLGRSFGVGLERLPIESEGEGYTGLTARVGSREFSLGGIKTEAGDRSLSFGTPKFERPDIFANPDMTPEVNPTKEAIPSTLSRRVQLNSLGNAPPNERVYFSKGIGLTEDLRTTKVATPHSLNFIKLNGLSENENAAIVDVIRGTSKNIDVLYGSSTVGPQLEGEPFRMGNDVDIQYNLSDSETLDMAKRFSGALNNASGYEKYTVVGKNVETLPSASDAGHTVVNLHSSEESPVEYDILTKSQGRLGFKNLPNFKAEDVGVQRVGQTLTNKASSALTPRYNENGEFEFAPANYRSKDVADFINISKGLNAIQGGGYESDIADFEKAALAKGVVTPEELNKSTTFNFEFRPNAEPETDYRGYFPSTSTSSSPWSGGSGFSYRGYYPGSSSGSSSPFSNFGSSYFPSPGKGSSKGSPPSYGSRGFPGRGSLITPPSGANPSPPSAPPYVPPHSSPGVYYPYSLPGSPPYYSPPFTEQSKPKRGWLPGFFGGGVGMYSSKTIDESSWFYREIPHALAKDPFALFGRAGKISRAERTPKAPRRMSKRKK
jgi:hypothetical protein